MDRAQIEAGVLKVFQSEFPEVGEVDVKSLMNDVYGVASVSLIEILVALEKEFDITFADRELSLKRYPDIESIIDAVEKKLN